MIVIALHAAKSSNLNERNPPQAWPPRTGFIVCLTSLQKDLKTMQKLIPDSIVVNDDIPPPDFDPTEMPIIALHWFGIRSTVANAVATDSELKEVA